MQNHFWKVWLTPLIIAFLSAVGLLSALTGDDIWDIVSWLSLGFPVLIVFWFLNKSKKRIKTK